LFLARQILITSSSIPPLARSSSANLVTNVLSSRRLPVVAHRGSKPAMTARRHVFPMSRYGLWHSWVRGLRRIMARRRIPNGPLMKPESSGSRNPDQSQRCIHCPLTHQTTMMSYTSTSRSTSFRGYIDHSPLWGSPPSISSPPLRQQFLACLLAIP